MKNFFKQKSMLRYFVECWTIKIVNYRGRASRKEYLGFVLYFIIGMVLVVGIFGEGNDSPGVPPLLKYMLLSFIPYLSLTFRRIHDMEDKTEFSIEGVGMFIIGHILLAPILLFWGAYIFAKGEQCANEYGPDPRTIFPKKKEKAKKKVNIFNDDDDDNDDEDLFEDE